MRTQLGRDLRSRIGTIAMAIGFAVAIGAVGARPALADGHDHGPGHDNGHQQGRHDNGRRGRGPEHHYYVPERGYYGPPNYEYQPPVYYDQPRPSQGWTFIFP